MTEDCSSLSLTTFLPLAFFGGSVITMEAEASVEVVEGLAFLFLFFWTYSNVEGSRVVAEAEGNFEALFWEPLGLPRVCLSLTCVGSFTPTTSVVSQSRANRRIFCI